MPGPYLQYSDLSGSEMGPGIDSFNGSPGGSNLQPGLKITTLASVFVQNNYGLYLGNHSVSLSWHQATLPAMVPWNSVNVGASQNQLDLR